MYCCDSKDHMSICDLLFDRSSPWIGDTLGTTIGIIDAWIPVPEIYGDCDGPCAVGKGEIVLGSVNGLYVELSTSWVVSSMMCWCCLTPLSTHHTCTTKSYGGVWPSQLQTNTSYGVCVPGLQDLRMHQCLHWAHDAGCARNCSLGLTLLLSRGNLLQRTNVVFEEAPNGEKNNFQEWKGSSVPWFGFDIDNAHSRLLDVVKVETFIC